MQDEKSTRWLQKFMNDKSDLAEDTPSYGSERQLTSQAFNLHVEQKDGRRAEGFGWSHYVGYEWADEGAQERLTVVFGNRVIEIEGTNLGVLVDDIREGKLNRIRELATARGKQLEDENPENEPIIKAVKVYPDFKE